MNKRIIVVVTLLIVKHVLFDLAFNNENKISHSIFHGVATTTILLASVPVSIPVTFLLGSIDSTIHFSVDISKREIFKHLYKINKTVTPIQYWFLTIVDQILHLSTYILIIKKGLR